MIDVTWLPEPPRTLAEKAAALELNHNDRCLSYEACDCFERLIAAVRGEPDPRGDHFGSSTPDMGPRPPTPSQWAAMGVDPNTLPLAARMSGYFVEAYADHMAQMLGLTQ